MVLLAMTSQSLIEVRGINRTIGVCQHFSEFGVACKSYNKEEINKQ